ncbi:MAG: PKD domain-containing protein, partial [Thermoplasmata archaeon]|nr:PKD domain-containing protein [Thermoplasmata archaeon]
STCDFSDFWQFQSVASGWFNVSRISSGNPGGRAQAAIGLDWSTGYLVLAGGYNDSSFAVVNTTWNFHCVSTFSCYWVNLTAGSRMPYRFAMAYSSDPSSHALWFEGGSGRTFGSTKDQWAYGLPPSGLSLMAQPGTTEPGKTVYLNSSVTGGAAPFNASWSFPELGTVSIGKPTNWTTNFPRVGTFHVELTLQDLHGFLIATTKSVLVVPPPEFNITGPSAGDPGIAMSFSALATIGKGLPPYQYGWSWGDGGLGTGSAPFHAYALLGSYVLNVTLSDRVGGRALQSVPVLVHASPQLTATASVTTIDPGMSIAFSASGSLGTPPYTFAWAFGDGGSGSSARTNHTYAAPGTVIVTATLTDAAGGTANATLLVSVNAALGGSAHANRTSVTVHELVHFDASATGGLAPYTYGWSFGASGQATGAPVDHAFSTPGGYSITLTIHDALGQSVVRTLTVNVTAAPPPGGGGASSNQSSGGLSLTSPIVLGGIALVIVAGALAATQIVLRRRKKGPSEKDDARPHAGSATARRKPPPTS